MFFLNGLPKLNHPLFNSDNFKKATDDGFFVCIESEDPLFEEDKVKSLLKDAGGTNIETIFDE
ncbi:MAG: quinol:electron acceptor oxidoreductase subunit ActD, partial [Balneolaceae bacterium]